MSKPAGKTDGQLKLSASHFGQSMLTRQPTIKESISRIKPPNNNSGGKIEPRQKPDTKTPSTTPIGNMRPGFFQKSKITDRKKHKEIGLNKSTETGCVGKTKSKHKVRHNFFDRCSIPKLTDKQKSQQGGLSLSGYDDSKTDLTSHA